MGIGDVGMEFCFPSVIYSISLDNSFIQSAESVIHGWHYHSSHIMAITLCMFTPL